MKTINSRLIATNALLGITLFITCGYVYAYEDVPPAVPVEAVEAKTLPLPEPIRTQPIITKKQTVPEYKAEKQEQKNKNADSQKPNLLERLWQKIKTVAKSKSVEEQERPDQKKKKQKRKYKAPVIIIQPDTLETTVIEEKKAITESYLTRALMPVIPEEGSGFYVLELFTTQACPFCPKADAMMKTYSSLSHVIALSCHVDYFDVLYGSLSLSICSARQKRYESFLNGMPKYTPQMVVNGRYDAVGYLPDKMAKAFKQAHEYPVDLLTVIPQDKEQTDLPSYRVALPKRDNGNYHLWLIAYDQPNNLTVMDGANAGKEMVYYNVVSKAEFLGSWNGRPKEVTIETKIPENTKGFTILVQDIDTGAILMAGKNE